MVDLFIVVAVVAVGAGLGLPFALLLPPSRFRWRAAIAPTLGIGLAAVGTEVAYVHGAPVGATLAALALAALAAATWWAVRALRAWPRDPAAAREIARTAGLLAAVWAAAALLMLAPRWAGGDQFAVFQGNQWDGFAYMQSAAVFAQEPYDAVARAGREDFVRNPMRAHAKSNIGTRPAVHLLYAAFTRLSPTSAYRLQYAFLVALLSQVVLASLFVLGNWIRNARTGPLVAASLVFPLGFWGQYVLDINAWSQTSSVAVLLLVLGLLVEVASAPRSAPSSAEGLRVAAVLAVALAGAIFLYPEGLAYYVVTLVPPAVAAVVLRARKGEIPLGPALLPFSGLAGIAAGALHYEATLSWALAQFTSSQRTILPFWKFFQAFFGGRDGWGGDELAAGTDFLAALYGLYFATPARDATPGVALLLRALIVVLAMGATAALGATLRADRATGGPDPFDRSRLRIGAAAMSILLAPAAVLALQGNYWPAGKGVSFAAPAFMALLAVPIAFPFAGRLRPLRWVAAALVVFQLGCAIARIPAAAGNPADFYAAPYPSTQDARLKQRLSWDLEPLAAQLAGVSHVVIRPMNPWSETYAMLFLQAHGVAFAPMSPVNTNYGAGEDLGPPPPPPWAPDADLSLVRAGWVMRFRDGRPPVATVSLTGVR